MDFYIISVFIHLCQTGSWPSSFWTVSLSCLASKMVMKCFSKLESSTKETNAIAYHSAPLVVLWSHTEQLAVFCFKKKLLAFIDMTVQEHGDARRGSTWWSNVVDGCCLSIFFFLFAIRHLCRPCHNREKARGLGKYICQKCHAIIEERPLLFKNDPYHPDHFNCNNCG